VVSDLVAQSRSSFYLKFPAASGSLEFPLCVVPPIPAITVWFGIDIDLKVIFFRQGLQRLLDSLSMSLLCFGFNCNEIIGSGINRDSRNHWCASSSQSVTCQGSFRLQSSSPNHQPAAIYTAAVCLQNNQGDLFSFCLFSGIKNVYLSTAPE